MPHETEGIRSSVVPLRIYSPFGRTNYWDFVTVEGEIADTLPLDAPSKLPFPRFMADVSKRQCRVVQIDYVFSRGACANQQPEHLSHGTIDLIETFLDR